MTAWALSGYAIGLTGYAAIKVLSPAFYALDDAKTPMIIALGSIVVNVVASYFLMKILSGVLVTETSPSGLGHVGVSLATSCVALVNFFALAWFMRGKIKRLNGREIFASFVKIAIASAAMSVVAYSSFHYLTAQFPVKHFSSKMIEAFVPIGLAGITFLIAAKILRIGELEKLFKAFGRKLGRR
jgi:putative peptidoglycan lipid II flippase